MSLSEVKAALMCKGYDFPINLTGGKPPLKVTAAPRLRDDVSALIRLFTSEIPPQRCICTNNVCKALYMFGDASGIGFGSSLTMNSTVLYRHGQWNNSLSKES
jgi:hypothetical protein